MATTNYYALQHRADEYNTARVTLHEAKVNYELRDKDVAQNQGLYDSIAADYDRRKSEGTIFAADLTKATADVTSLDAKQLSLTTDKGTKLGVRDHAWDELYKPTTGLEQLIDDAQTDVKTEQDALAALYTTLNTNTTTLVTKREELEALKSDLETEKSKLADLEAAADGYTTVPASLQAEITSTNATITTLNADIATKIGEIATAEGAVATASAAVDTKKTAVATAVAAVRVLQVTRAEKKAAYDTAVLEFLAVANELQNIEGSAVPTVPSTAGYPATAPKKEMAEDANVDGTTPDAVATTNGHATPGSRLYVATETKTAMTAVDGAYNTATTGLIAQLLASKNGSKAVLDAAVTALDTAKTDLKTADDDLVAARAALDTMIASQKTVEVDAAISLLTDFLKNMDLVISGGPTLDESITAKIEETCPSSKVRVLVERIRAAYADPDEYKALLAEMCKDPVAVFLNTEPHCFDELSIEDSAYLQTEIRDAFLSQARTLLKKYGGCGSSGLSMLQIFLIILVVVAVIALGYYLFLRK